MSLRKPARTRAVEQLNALLKERATTVPDLSAGNGPRSGPGPVKDGLERLRLLFQGLSSMGLFLVSYLVDSQRYSDATGWWEGADNYIERVSAMMRDLIRLSPSQADAMKKLPFSADDLLSRLSRVKLLEILFEMSESLHGKLRDTLLVERADLMRMADIVMTEVEQTLGRPTLDLSERTLLDDLSAIPLNLWHKWLDRLQEAQKRNEALRSDRQDEIDAANQAAAAAEAVAKIALGQRVTADEALAAAQPPKAAANQRNQQRH